MEACSLSVLMEQKNLTPSLHYHDWILTSARVSLLNSLIMSLTFGLGHGDWLSWLWGWFASY